MISNAPRRHSSELDQASMDTSYVDLEQDAVTETHLRNTAVRNLSWSNVTVTVKDRVTKSPKVLVDNVDGHVEAGEILALMGPSGCGKTTLLNALASRPAQAARVDGRVLVNGTAPAGAAFRRLSAFVEQEDALVGSLTARETLGFALRLSGGGGGGGGGAVSSRRERAARVEGLLDSLGLRGQADTIVGTPVRRGLSGGQKRRVGIASQLVTGPRILFLDEPTSGLDSAAGYEVVRHLRGIAAGLGLVVVASIHQPSTATFNLFDKVMLLSGGKTHYFGPLRGVSGYYDSIGHPVPLHTNPAECLLDRLNVDFSPRGAGAGLRLQDMQHAWASSAAAKALASTVAHAARQKQDDTLDGAAFEGGPGFLSLVSTLLHRSFIKSYRDVVAYGVRMAMYLGLAVMMGTVWARLKTEQEYIQPFINAIFFGGAFMSFMAVAYVPAYLEDRNLYVKEFHNGLYGAAELVVSNFLVGVPYLFVIALGFSSVSYWLSNFHPTAAAFFTWVMWVFLDLLAAESLVVLLSSLVPNFVVALALVAFANGLWMCVNGFMVQPALLNGFYKYVFSYWDYQKYVFEGMMVNEFSGRAYSCGSGCRCMYQTELADQCLIAGDGVLAVYGYEAGYLGKNVGVMVSIIVGYRVAAWLVLLWRR